jgi:hypothetical protein
MLSKHGFSPVYIDSKGNNRLVPNNIVLVAKKESYRLGLRNTNLPLDNYKRIIAILWLRRFSWYLSVWMYFFIVDFKRYIKSIIVHTKFGTWLKNRLFSEQVGE